MKKDKPKKINKAKLLKSLKDELWRLAKQYCRLKYPPVCYTCGRSAIGKNCQTGHFLPSLDCPFTLDYHPNNLRLQCMRCNKWSGGYGSQFYHNFRRDHGQEYVDRLFYMRDNPTITEPTIENYQDYIEFYKQKIKNYKEYIK